MIIKTPQKYISEAGILNNAGEYVSGISSKPLIIGSKHALAAAGEKLEKSLLSSGINPVGTLEFSGYPSENQFEFYRKKAEETGADALIAAGGGRVLDTVKAAGELAGLPVIAVPTIAATCAAWAALTIQYDDEGSFVKPRPLKKSPVLILADTEIILSAPERYLFAGVSDTFAKFYEIRPVYKRHRDSINTDIAFYAAQRGLEILKDSVFTALDEAKKGVFGKAAKDVVDSVVYIAGFAGSFQSDTGYYSFAHPFYHISARFPSTRHRLHGEKVAFGIIAQLFLEKKKNDYIEESLRLFDRYRNTFTLTDIGLCPCDRDTLKNLAEQIKTDFPYVEWSTDEIVESLISTDKIVNEFRNKEKN